MMGPIRVTVMVPTYNQAEFLRDCLQSIVTQDYPDLEIVVGDDCSTDSTREVLAGFDDPRLRIVRHPHNRGRVGNYRELLYHHASGDWVLNLDGDDYLSSPSAISSLVAATSEAQDAVFVAGSVETVFDSVDRELEHLPRREGQLRQGRGSRIVLPGIDIVDRFWDDDRGIKHAGVLYRRSAALACDFYRMDIISSDIESLLRLALRGSVVLVDAPIAAWRIHGGNESGSDDIESRLANLQLVDGVAEEYLRHATPRTVRRWRRRMRFRMVYGTAIRLIRANRTADVAPFVRRALPSMFERLRLRLSPKYLYHRIRGR